jgi:hypothetical protein
MRHTEGTPMRRPLVVSTALATALAAELAVGALLVAPPAVAQEIPGSGEDPTAPVVEAPTRTGRTDDAPPAPDAPADVPDSPAPVVRSGRVGDVAAPDGGLIVDSAPATEPTAAPAAAAPTAATPAAGEETGSNGDAPAGGHPGADTGPRTAGSSGHQPGGDQSGRSTDSPADPATPPSGSTSPAPVPPAPAVPLTHAVVPGDNLWEIAAAHLATASGRPRAELGALDIAPYWTQLCMVNRPHLVSGDVSLIYAGEMIELPAL